MVWGVYLFLLLNTFFISVALPEWVFGILIHGFVPLGILTFIAATWGNKLREVESKDGS